MKLLHPKLLLPGALFFTLFSPTVMSQGSLASCADIEDAQERLTCYDRAAENASTLPVIRLPRNTSQQSTETVANPRTAAQPRRDEFGLEMKQERQQNRGPDTRTFTVLSARHNDFTGWTIEFDGAGIWKQVGTDDFSIEVGERYTVRRATFSSYMLSREGNNKKIRITRVE
jgi:hypothetical protein